MAHHNHHQNRNQQKARSQQDSVLQRLQRLQEKERGLLDEIAFETSRLQVPAKDFFLSLISSRYRQAKLREKTRRQERIAHLSAQLVNVQREILITYYGFNRP